MTSAITDKRMPVGWLFLPYCIAERRLREREGTDGYLEWIGEKRIKRSPWYWMPFPIVDRWLKHKRLRRNRNRAAAVKTNVGSPHSGFDRSALPEALARLAAERDDSAARRRDARILVCLHMFYSDLWPIVRRYLENLNPYVWSFLVTYPEGLVPNSLLSEIRDFHPSVTLIPCRNAGFDIGPFVESLRAVDLKDFDIVFKVQTKGCGRPSIFIYNQVFKRADWFFNLFDGVLGGKVVHRVVDALMDGSCSLAAAENLVVDDPKHKCNYVRRFCAERSLPYVEGYRFVAGTCFAVRAEALAPLKALGLSLADFAVTKRGNFSLAHALERWMCFASTGRIWGVPVGHAEYPEERDSRIRHSALRLLDDPRFDLDDDFVYRAFEFCEVNGYEVVEVNLGDIHRVWTDNRLYRLEDCAPYRYIMGDAAAYGCYCRENPPLLGTQMSCDRFERLRLSMKAYDPRRMPIVFGDRNIIVDGQHRCCILLKQFGPSYRLPVVRIW